MPAAESHRVIERALLGYIVVVVVLLTLAPFRFVWPTHWIIDWWGDSRDAPSNFLLFLPVGYFLRLSLPGGQRRAPWWALLFGGALSFAIETLQLFLPERLTSLWDLLSDSVGAAAGAVLCGAVRRRFDRMLPAGLTLEHPLLNLVYLIVPLMWLTGVGVETEPARVWLLAPLGAMGALTLSGLWRHRYAVAAAMPRPALAVLVLGWFLFGAVTGLSYGPLVVAQCAAGIFVLTLTRLYLGRSPVGLDRRFEQRVLASVWPCFVIYLLMLVGWPLPHAYAPFDYAVGYPEIHFDRNFTLRIAEQLGALTLFGYLLAESRGRRRLPSRRLLGMTMLWGACCALLMEFAHGLLPGDRASLLRWGLGSLGAAFGVSLYVAQMNVVQVLRGRT